MEKKRRLKAREGGSRKAWYEKRIHPSGKRLTNAARRQRIKQYTSGPWGSLGEANKGNRKGTIHQKERWGAGV